MRFEPGEINILCSDAARSLHFYRDLLGFTASSDAEGFIHLQAGGHQFLLLPIAAPGESYPPYGSIPQLSVDLYVEDLRAAYTHFQAHGVPFAQEWREGHNMFAIRDPDGLPWEVIQRQTP